MGHLVSTRARAPGACQVVGPCPLHHTSHPLDSGLVRALAGPPRPSDGGAVAGGPRSYRARLYSRGYTNFYTNFGTASSHAQIVSPYFYFFIFCNFCPIMVSDGLTKE